MLIQNGAELEFTSTEGCSALLASCCFNQPGTAQLLIKMGAKLNSVDFKGRSALMLACCYNEPKAAELLIKKGAEINLVDKIGWSALMYACRFDQPETTALLIQEGAKLDLVDVNGMSALMLACFDPYNNRTESAMLKSLQYCYVGGANIQLSTSRNYYFAGINNVNKGSVVLDIARLFGPYSVVDFLEVISGPAGS